jgi:hypothetical protein
MSTSPSLERGPESPVRRAALESLGVLGVLGPDYCTIRALNAGPRELLPDLHLVDTTEPRTARRAS